MNLIQRLSYPSPESGLRLTLDRLQGMLLPTRRQPVARFLMKISTRSEYAAKALLYLAIAEQDGPGGQPTQIPAIAHECAIPVKYLEQILVVLRNHGILASRRGAAGGYFLLRSAEQITVGEVVRLMDGGGSVAGNLPACAASDTICGTVRSLWAEVDLAVSATLDSVTLRDLCARFTAERAAADSPAMMFYI